MVRFLLIILIFSLGYFHHEAQAESGAYAVIVRVEGKGNARVRRKTGTEVSAAVNSALNAGDKIITDKEAAVHVLLFDGTFVRIGTNSEYKFEKMNSSNRFVHWLFTLIKGNVRALIDRSPQKNVKFQVDTPSGTIGVRGTELLIQAEEEKTQLFTLDGVVEFGAKGCLSNASCVKVKKGQQSMIKKGDKKPSNPAAFAPGDIIGVEGVGAEMKQLREGTPFARRELMQALVAADKDLGKLTKEQLDALIKKLQKDFELAQAALLRRSPATKELMEKAMDAGTYAAYIKAAERYMELNGVKYPDDMDHASVNAAKFALAMELERMGAFSESGVRKARLDGNFHSGDAPLSAKSSEITAGTRKLSSSTLAITSKNPKMSTLNNFLSASSKCCVGCSGCYVHPPYESTGGEPSSATTSASKQISFQLGGSGTISKGGSGSGCYKSVQDCSTGTCRSVTRLVDCSGGSGASSSTTALGNGSTTASTPAIVEANLLPAEETPLVPPPPKELGPAGEQQGIIYYPEESLGVQPREGQDGGYKEDFGNLFNIGWGGCH